MGSSASHISFPFGRAKAVAMVLASTKRIVVLRGGTRSAKTYSILIVLSHWLLTGYFRYGEHIPTGTALVVRKYAATLRGTVLKDFEEVVHRTKLGASIVYNKTNRTFSFDGRTVEFIGADDEQKLRGRKSNILYCNEGNELNYRKEFFQLLVRCTGPVLIDFNPSDPYIWIKEELEDKRALEEGDVETIVTTYKDNPYLTDTQINEIENLEYSDPELWAVYGLGQYGKVEGLVVPSIHIIHEWPTDLSIMGSGMDFGFANDPTALYKCAIKKVRRKSDDGRTIEVHQLYVDQQIYETGLNEADLIHRLKDIDYPRSTMTMCDSSHPGAIETMRRAGFNAKRADKRPGSLRHGISLLRSHEIYATARSSGIIKEQKQYKFKSHVNGGYINDPIDNNNHAFDAIRYFLLRFSKLRPFK